MNVKAALDLYRELEKNIASDKKILGKAMVSPEELALRTMVSAYLKQRLVIKKLQKDNIRFKKGDDKWNKFFMV